MKMRIHYFRKNFILCLLILTRTWHLYQVILTILSLDTKETQRTRFNLKVSFYKALSQDARTHKNISSQAMRASDSEFYYNAKQFN